MYQAAVKHGEILTVLQGCYQYHPLSTNEEIGEDRGKLMSPKSEKWQGAED